MDPSASVAQDVQNQQPNDQAVNNTPSTATQIQQASESNQSANQVLPAPAQQPKNPISVSFNKEGSSMIMTENPDLDEEDDEELQVAPRETKGSVGIGQGEDEEDEQNTQAVSVSPQASADVQQEAVEVRPSVPEFAAGSPEVEKIIEKKNYEEPTIPKEVEDAGVTRVGPGVIPNAPIDVSQNDFGIKTLPVAFDVAEAEEEKTELHDSKHWLMGKIMYYWRKLNPMLGKQKKKKEEKQLVKN